MARRERRAHAGVPRRPRGAGLRRALPGLAAGLDDPHRGARRRRLGLHGDLLQRRVLGRGRARAPASTSTTCWARRTSTRWASTAIAPGRRMPSMMAPTIVLRDGEPELVLGSAGSNRIRSAILQTIVGVVDHGLAAGPAVEAPRVHFEDGVVWAEPGISEDGARGRRVSRAPVPGAERVLRRRAGRRAPARHRRAVGRRRPAPRRRRGGGVRRAAARRARRGGSARGRLRHAVGRPVRRPALGLDPRREPEAAGLRRRHRALQRRQEGRHGRPAAAPGACARHRPRAVRQARPRAHRPARTAC